MMRLVTVIFICSLLGGIGCSGSGKDIVNPFSDSGSEYGSRNSDALLNEVSGSGDADKARHDHSRR